MDSITIYIVFSVLSLFILFLLRLLIVHWIKGRRRLRNMAVGKKMEHKAKRIIAQLGFKNIRYQENFFYTLNVNGETLKICCIPDFVAEKKGKSCVIEVKWGNAAPSVTLAATRRQLLEYQYVIKPNHLFLLDMTKKHLNEVIFN